MTVSAGRWILTAATLGVSLLYFPINRPWGTVHNLALPIDRHIPEVPIFVIPYLLGFYGMIVVGGVYLLRHESKLYERLCASILLASLVAYAVFLTFQTAVPRGLIAEPDLFGRILNWIRNTDRIYSAFPSGHTFLTTIFTWHLWKILPGAWRPWLILNAAAIIAATLLLRQHYVLDPLAGLVLGLGACWIVHGLYRET